MFPVVFVVRLRTVHLIQTNMKRFECFKVNEVGPEGRDVLKGQAHTHSHESLEYFKASLGCLSLVVVRQR